MRSADQAPRTQRRRASLGLLAASALTVLSLGACSAPPGANVNSGGQGNGGTGVAAAPASLTLVQSVENVAFLPTYVADAKGFWKEQNLTVKIVENGNNSAINAALIAGEAQIAASQSDGPVRAVLNGAPTMMLGANLTSRPTMVLVLRKEVLKEKGITESAWNAMSYKDKTKIYKGLKFGTFGPGGLIDSVVSAVIKEAGYADGDVTRVTINGAGPTLAALNAGTIDVMALSPPHPLQAIEQGTGILIGSIKDVSKTLSDFAYESVSIMKTWVDANPDVAGRFGMGLAKACDYARTAKPDVLAEELQKAGWFKEYDRKILVTSLTNMQDAVPEKCKITQGSIDNMLKLNLEINKFTNEELAKFKLTEGNLWTNQLLK